MTSQIADVCPGNFQDERQHGWGWCSVTSFVGGRSGTYAKCGYCEAEDWAVLDRLVSEMPPPEFRAGDTVMYRDERWRWDVTGNIRLDLVKVTDYEAIVLDSFVCPGLGQGFDMPLERRYSVLCRNGDKLFERTPTSEALTQSSHGGTIAEWKAAQPKPKPYRLEDDDPALTEPRLRSIGVEFEIQDHSYRCARCHRMQDKGSPIAFVSDSFRVGDSWRSMVEQHQQRCHNGHSSGWCAGCAHRLLPTLCKSYLRFKLTGNVPLRVYMKPVCWTCKKDMSGGSYYYRNIGEDMWEVYCRECRYATHSHDMYEGGFGQIMGSSSLYIGTLAPGQSVTL